MSSFLFAAILGCQKNNAVNTFNYEKDTPVWLREKIDSISTQKIYALTKVYRYELHNKYIYYFKIPLSSCVYCEVYDSNGNKIQFNDEKVSDFEKNKKNEVLVWEWKE